MKTIFFNFIKAQFLGMLLGNEQISSTLHTVTNCILYIFICFPNFSHLLYGSCKFCVRPLMHYVCHLPPTTSKINLIIKPEREFRLPPPAPHQPLCAVRTHVPLQLAYSTAFSEDGSQHGWKSRPWSLTAQMPTLASPLTHCVMGGEPLNLSVGQLPYPIYRHDNSLYFTED